MDQIWDVGLIRCFFLNTRQYICILNSIVVSKKLANHNLYYLMLYFSLKVLKNILIKTKKFPVDSLLKLALQDLVSVWAKHVMRQVDL